MGGNRGKLFAIFSTVFPYGNGPRIEKKNVYTRRIKRRSTYYYRSCPFPSKTTARNSIWPKALWCWSNVRSSSRCRDLFVTRYERKRSTSNRLSGELESPRNVTTRSARDEIRRIRKCIARRVCPRKVSPTKLITRSVAIPPDIFL